jgi:hypothetical protein
MAALENGPRHANEQRRMSRRLAVGAAVAASALLGGMVAAVAATSGSGSALDQQAGMSTSTSATTTSTTFRPLPGLHGLNVCALHQVSATLSVVLHGAPAAFQVRVDGGPTMAPGAVRFAPVGKHDFSSFTFLRSVGPFEANDHHVFDVEWRSPTGAPATLDRGTLNLLFERGTQAC